MILASLHDGSPRQRVVAADKTDYYSLMRSNVGRSVTPEQQQLADMLTQELFVLVLNTLVEQHARHRSQVR
ncbi:MAG: hypothetical protein GPOALKHO_000386 [Sodalis sp.]|nr:MAG: hypothetical protein GPOALKHO_000386 [Sodalis sp.]